MGDMSKEPSMEEILSSIKRIIAEEGEEGASMPRGPRRGRLEVVPQVETVLPEAQAEEAHVPTVEAEDDILELTPATEDILVEETAQAPITEAEAVIELTPPAFDTPEEPESTLVEVADEAPEAEMVAQAPEEPEPAPQVETIPVADEVLELTDEIDTEEKVTPSNAAPAMSGAETMISVESEVAARHSLSALSSMLVAPESGEGNTVEDLVKSMLRPLLKEWLDAKLPGLVEQMVAKEISRITGGVR
jgi:cell pole-organizing protein PopZ